MDTDPDIPLPTTGSHLAPGTHLHQVVARHRADGRFPFVFVGERRSPRAMAIGATWVIWSICQAAASHIHRTLS